MARFRDEDRRALFRLLVLFRALFRAERRAAFLADLLADLLAAFLAPLRDAFLRLDFLAVFLADLRRGCAALTRLVDGSPKSSYEAGVEAGVGGGVLSIGSGSIQPEPDQPISI